MFSHSVHPFLDNTILPYIILKIYSRNLIYSILEHLYKQMNFLEIGMNLDLQMMI